MASIPYEEATSGQNALMEIQRILGKFGCQSFGTMTDAERGMTVVQFKHRDRTVSLEASWKGYAAAWQRAHPWATVRGNDRSAYDRKALEIGKVAVCSVLRDWIKGQITAVEWRRDELRCRVHAAHAATFGRARDRSRGGNTDASALGTTSSGVQAVMDERIAEPPVSFTPLPRDDQPLSKADVDFEKVRWDTKWHALQALCEVQKLGKGDPHTTKCLHAIAAQIANL